MNEDLISIIIPVYNSEIYIEKAVRSVMNQTYKNIEIILIDDGSKDNSSLICDNLANEDSRIVVVHQENQGPSVAREEGVKISKGKYITFVDNDDLLNPQCIEVLYHAINICDCDIALTKSFPFLEEEKLDFAVTEQNYKVMDKYELTENLLNGAWTGLAITMCKLFKRELFDEIAFYKERVIGDDDSIIYKIFWSSNKSVLVSTPLYYYRMKRQGSITHSNYKMSWLTGVDAFYERMNFYKNQGEDRLYALAMRSYIRRVAQNLRYIKQKYPEEREVICELNKLERKYVKQMFFLPGNTIAQKVSAVLLAYFPNIWWSIEYAKKNKT